MAVQLTFGAYSHPITPNVKITREILFDDSGGRIGYEETWTIDGYFQGTQAELKTQADAIESAYAGTQTIAIKNGAVILKTLTTAACHYGPQASEGVSYPVGAGPEWATKREYHIVIKGKVIEQNPAWIYTTTYKENQELKQIVTHNGRYYKASGGAKSSFEAGYAAEMVIPGADWIKSDLTYTPDVNDEVVEFSLAYKQLYQAYASNVYDGGYTRREREAAGGGTILTISGRFVGSGALAAANALKENYPTMEESIEESPFEGGVSFNFVYLKDTREFIEYTEEVAIMSMINDFVLIPLLDGRSIVKQYTVRRPARAVQTGSALTTRRGAQAPAPYWPSNLKGHQVAYSKWLEGVNGKDISRTIRWSYDFEFEFLPVNPIK